MAIRMLIAIPPIIFTFVARNESFQIDIYTLEGVDFNGLAYEFGDSDISASINVNVVPIPGAVLLLSTGIIGLAGLRKKVR